MKPLAILSCALVMGIAGTTIPCAAQSTDALYQPRIWTSQSGAKVEARFLRLDNGWVVLQPKSNNEVKIKLSNLSEEDQALVTHHWVSNGFSIAALEENLNSMFGVKPIQDPQGKLVLAHEGIYSGWLYYSTKVDHVTTDLAVLVSNNAIPVPNKPDKANFLLLVLAYRPHVGNIVFLFLSETKIPQSDNSVFLSFDGKAPMSTVRKRVPKAEALFLEDSKKIVSELKKSKSLEIHVTVTGNTSLLNSSQTFSFNTFGLNWKH